MDPIPSAPDLPELDQALRHLTTVIGALLHTMVRKDLLTPQEARQLLEAALQPLRDGGSYPDRMFQPLFQMLRRLDPDGDY